MAVDRDENSRSSGPSWLTLRVVLLGLLVLTVGAVAAWRGAARLSEPRAGDRHAVAYEGEDECGFLRVRVDGLVLRASPDLDEPRVLPGNGTVVLDDVWTLPDGGFGTDGTLTLEDGSELGVSGGTEGKTFFTIPCRIRND